MFFFLNRKINNKSNKKIEYNQREKEIMCERERDRERKKEK